MKRRGSLLLTFLFLTCVAFAQDTKSTITGKVTDLNGGPLPGVSVVEKGTTNGTSTGIDGEYSINLSSSTTIIFSYIGFEAQEVVTASNKVVNITLIEETTGLDEVVVVGYGSKKKLNLTGAVAVVDIEKEVGERPVANVSAMLQGTLPGVTLGTNNSGGEPGATQNIKIRGYAGNPYILYDGMPITSAEMNAINPNDIKSVTTLKDAASAAIYGSKGAYGVILITSKSGVSGKTKVSISSNYGLSDVSVYPDMASGLDHALTYNQAAQNSGQAAVFKDEMLELLEQQMAGTLDYQTRLNDKGTRWENGFANTDWYKLFFKDNAPRQEHNISISGGSEKTTFFLSGGLLKSEGQLNFGNNQYNRKNLKAKISHKVNDWLSVDMISNYSNEEKKFPSGGFGSWTSSIIYHQLTRSWPNHPAYDPDGNVISPHILRLTGSGHSVDNTQTFNNKVSASITPIKGWTTKISYQQKNKFFKSDREQFQSLLNYPDGTTKNVGYPVDKIAKSHNFAKDALFNIVSTYNTTINEDHNISGLVGYEQRVEDFSNLYGSRDKLITQQLPVINLATGEQKTSDYVSDYSTQGYFARFGYNYKEKYLVEFNGRRDGSSYFPEGRKWGFFPSASVGYNISRENFWAPLESVVNSLKLRASWGELGDHNRIHASKYQELMTGGRERDWLMDGSRIIYTTRPSIVSSSLTWETVTTTNLGIDAGLFDNRLTTTAEYFISETTDIIGASSMIPSTFGAGAPLANYGATKTKGWELDVKWRDKIGEFEYSIGFNVTDSKRKISKWLNPDGLSNTYSKGDVIGDIWGYETVGYFESDEAAAAAPDQTFIHGKWKMGDVQYKDLNGDGKINNGDGTVEDRGDLKIIGNNRDRYRFGINLSASYKGLSLSVLLQGVAKKDYVFSQSTNLYYGFRGNKWQNSVTEASLDFWTPENVDAFFPKPYMTGEHLKNTKSQTKYVEDASYVRLKNVQLSYAFPEKMISKIGLTNLSVFVSGENLLLFTDLNENFDPETLGGGWGDGKIFPLSKTVSAGVKLSF